jgi:putative flippase GtrA
VGIDTGIVILLTALGVPVIVANVTGRLSGALAGFTLNGGVTFSEAGVRKRDRRHLQRYAIVWIAMTCVSTAMLTAVHGYAALGWVWLAKPIIEACLAGMSFLLSRYWIYR